MIHGAILRGLTALLVDVEIGVRRGTGFHVVGLGGPTVKESRERLRHAIEASGLDWPAAAITVNLAPADIPKVGTTLDLAIAIAILSATNQISVKDNDATYMFGELGLEGNLRRCKGALAIARAIPVGATLIAPEPNRLELALLWHTRQANKICDPLIARDLEQVVEIVQGRSRPRARARISEYKSAFHRGVDFRNVKGQIRAKRALAVAAAGVTI